MTFFAQVEAEDEVHNIQKLARSPEIRVTQEILVLPIMLVREFPFIEGSIAGVEGRLLLDTGAGDSLVINDNRVPVSNAVVTGKGFFGSGQSFETRLVPSVPDIRLGPLEFVRATNVESMDARLLEKITPDFIGWFGYRAFAGYTMKLDYQNLRATFYRDGVDYLAEEQVIVRIPFETRKLPNHPIHSGRIGTKEIVISWDTGQHGNLYTTEEGKDALLRERRLLPSATSPGCFDVYGVELSGYMMPVIPCIAVHTSPSPAAQPIGINETHWLILGYAVLHQFKTAWDFDGGSLYLLNQKRTPESTR